MLKLIYIVCLTLVVTSCSGPQDNANTTATTTVTPPPTQKLSLVPRPEKIIDERGQRGEQDEAKPVLKILSPVQGASQDGNTVAVRLSLSGDLKGYKPEKDPGTGMGNHIHVILDDNPYEAYYDLSQPFEFKDLTPGKHVLRVFASRPWHESYKNESAFQMVTFTVKGPEQSSCDVDPAKPLLTYSRPKGEYQGIDADPIMIDFWLSNAKLKGDGGQYLVRYIIDDDEPRIIDKWEPIWLSGWKPGKHTVRLELLGADQYPLKNGSFNITTRDISVVK